MYIVTRRSNVVDPGVQWDRGCVSLKESELAFPNLVKFRGREIKTKRGWMAQKVDRRLHSSAVETPVKFHSNLIMLKTNLVASRVDEI